MEGDETEGDGYGNDEIDFDGEYGDGREIDGYAFDMLDIDG
jgi:hypothetical protein